MRVRVGAVVVGLCLTLLAAAGATTVAAPATIVFVCEHGNVKSLMAASLFDRLAQERGLPFRAAARGVNPEPGVPPKIAQALGAEGFEVGDFKSQRLSDAEFASSTRVVAIGVDLRGRVAGTKTPIDTWNDVPPASVDYPAARAALLRHVEQLLAELAGTVQTMDPR